MEWPRGEAAACKAVYVGSNPISTSQQHHPSGAIGAAVARFPDTEEVTGSIPVSPTSTTREAAPAPSGAASLAPTITWTGCTGPGGSRLVCASRRSPRVHESPRRTGRADVAQLVEHHLAKVRVAGSSPVIRSEAHSLARSPGSMRGRVSRWSGREARQRPAKPYTWVRIPSPPRMQHPGDWRSGSALP